jgi:uncharacterized membrane protein YeiH
MVTNNTNRIVHAADIIGTFVFAIEGALAAMRGGLDVFGVLVLSFVTALGGGIIRDLLLGATTPRAFADWRYPVTAFLAGGIAFVGYEIVHLIPPGLLITLDAAGLSLFAVAGTEKALEYGIHPFIAPLLGTITAVGGGTIRDVLLNTVPSVLRVDVYATAALAGSIVLVIASRLTTSRNTPRAGAAIAGGVVCFALRMLSVALNWQLPHAITRVR